MSAFKSNANTSAAREKAELKERLLGMALNPYYATAGENNAAGYMNNFSPDDPVLEDVNTAITDLDTDGAFDVTAGDFVSNVNTETHQQKWARRERILNAALDAAVAGCRSVDGVEKIYSDAPGFSRSDLETEVGLLKTGSELDDVDQPWPSDELPIHPSTTPTDDLFEYENLYNGVKATMTFVEDGTSTWVFPAGVIAPEDVDQVGMKIKIRKNQFGPDPVPTPLGNRYIAIDAMLVWMKVWEITKMTVDESGNITLNMDIPPLVV